LGRGHAHPKDGAEQEAHLAGGAIDALGVGRADPARVGIADVPQVVEDVQCVLDRREREQRRLPGRLRNRVKQHRA